MFTLLNSDEFSKVKLEGSSLSWNNVAQYISSKTGHKIRVLMEIGADILLKYSKPERIESIIHVGQLIRDTRLKAGMSQRELALVSGTSKTYISRIENDKSDIESDTLRKLIEAGLGKRMEIVIK